MKIEIDCSKVEISHSEFRAFLYHQYYSSQGFILKLIVLLLVTSFSTAFFEFSFDNRLLDNIFLIGKIVITTLFTVWTFCPSEFFRFKKTLEEYCKEGAIIFCSAYGNFLISKSWLDAGEYGELKALLAAIGVKSNL